MEVTLVTYVDGFVIPIQKKNVNAYRRMAKASSKIFKEHGAVEFRECVADDLSVTDPQTGKRVALFPRMVKPKPGETILFSWVVYRSKTQRDRANAKIMKDPRILKIMAGKPMPFDMKRMAYGGFKAIVEA